MSKQKTINIPPRTPEGKLTFWGFFEEYFEYICKKNYWRAASTKKAHWQQMINTIVPAIEHHDVKPINQYRALDIDKAIIQIREMGKISGRDSKRKPYDESTLGQFKTVLRQVLEMAATLNMCPPLSEAVNKTRAPQKTNGLAVRRHMTPEEEAKFLIEILPKLLTCGAARLALIIYDTGIRPSEACALNWGMLRYNAESDVCTILLGQSVEPGYNRPKLTMKTCNGHRVMVVDKLVYVLLMLVKELLLARWIQDGNTAESFDELPLGTKGEGLTKRCSNHDINDFINPIYVKIGIRSDELDSLKNDMWQEYDELTEVFGYDTDINDYLSTSTYLLRHVRATANVPLLLTTSARQYFHGHKVSNPEVSRRALSSSPVQQCVQQKRQEQPLLNPIKPKVYELRHGQPLSVKGYSEEIVVPPCTGWVDLYIAAEEPGDSIFVTIESENGTNMVGDVFFSGSWQRPPETGYPNQINVQRFYHEYYKDAAQMLLQAFPGIYDGVAPWDEQQKTE